MTKTLPCRKFALLSFCFLYLFLSQLALPGYGQTTDTIKEVALEEVVVRAYEANRRLRDIPAAVSYIGKGTLERFSPSSIVQAVNTAPGVRLEERSPGSYRFNIRGS